MKFVHQRHQPSTPLTRDRELVVAVPPMRSQVNLSRIVRAAGCCGVTQLVAGQPAKIDLSIARDAADYVRVERHRSLLPVVQRLKREGYRVVSLEQATGSVSIYDYRFQRRSLLIVGHERTGVSPDLLAISDDVIEIPIYGVPPSHNAATSAALAMYEYCRQYPEG